VRPPDPAVCRARRHAGRRYSPYFLSEHLPARLPDLPTIHEPEEPGRVVLKPTISPDALGVLIGAVPVHQIHELEPTSRDVPGKLSNSPARIR
jgi:hypothetical protein